MPTRQSKCAVCEWLIDVRVRLNDSGEVISSHEKCRRCGYVCIFEKKIIKEKIEDIEYSWKLGEQLDNSQQQRRMRQIGKIRKNIKALFSEREDLNLIDFASQHGWEVIQFTPDVLKYGKRLSFKPRYGSSCVIYWFANGWAKSQETAKGLRAEGWFKTLREAILS